jgi:hypothetical protein
MAHHCRKFSFCCCVRCDASWLEQRSFFLDDSARGDILQHVAPSTHNLATDINPFNLFLPSKASTFHHERSHCDSDPCQEINVIGLAFDHRRDWSRCPRRLVSHGPFAPAKPIIEFGKSIWHIGWVLSNGNQGCFVVAIARQQGSRGRCRLRGTGRTQEQ